MRTLVTALAVTAALIALAGCGSDGVDLGATPTADGGTEASETTITGTLAGDADLEGGCVWVEAADGRYEVQWPDGWQASADPVEVRNAAGEVVARAGDELRVTGRIRSDVATVCQVGTVLEATEATTQ
jgi:hypothetical protein